MARHELLHIGDVWKQVAIVVFAVNIIVKTTFVLTYKCLPMQRQNGNKITENCQFESSTLILFLLRVTAGARKSV